MMLVLAILLAIFVLHSPWSLIAILVGAVYEVVQIVGGIWWSQRRRAQVGAEALEGQTARVVDRCDPYGKVSVKGEIWNARCDAGADVDEIVRISGLSGLTLIVEPQ
jgi:membrane-bound serine protease (ClpP class)